MPPKPPRPCWAATRRLCALTPLFTLTLVSTISASTVYSGWLHPLGLRIHSQAELAFFALQVLLLLWSYLSAVLWGPGFIPPGWTPSEEEISSRLDSKALLPLDARPPVRDLLQYCDHCEGYKPPRVHHCSECRRCVLWMDHHCPWTGTCVGHQNMQAFVLFVHYAPLSCLHSVLIHGEVPLKLFFFWYAGRSANFWNYLLRPQVILALVFGIAALIVLLLVGSLAWNIRWSIDNNMTMVEELVMEKADARRIDHREASFTFPYDLGRDRNWEEMIGKGWRSRILPQRPTSQAYWPSLRRGAGHFDFSVEQIAQKVQKMMRSYAVQVAKNFDAGKGRWCCLYWFRVACRHGCGAACPCSVGWCDKRLSVEKGDWMLMSRREGSWSQVRPLIGGAAGLPGEPRGWVPHSCFVSGEYQRYELPNQRLLQGMWEVASKATEPSSTSGADSGTDGSPTAKAARKVRVMGALALVPTSKVAYTLRAEGEEGEALSLLGVRLLGVEGRTARWENGEVWQRPVADPEGQAPASSRVRRRFAASPTESSAAATDEDASPTAATDEGDGQEKKSR